MRESERERVRERESEGESERVREIERMSWRERVGVEVLVQNLWKVQACCHYNICINERASLFEVPYRSPQEINPF